MGKTQKTLYLDTDLLDRAVRQSSYDNASQLVMSLVEEYTGDNDGDLEMIADSLERTGESMQAGGEQLVEQAEELRRQQD